MESVVAVVAVVGAIGAFLLGFARLAIRARTRCLGITFMGPFADLWDPGYLRTDVVIESQAWRGGESPESGAPPAGSDIPRHVGS
jgi:hypothetical protein